MSERGYLDGVPLRLNPKFFPQPRPQFKEVDIHIPVDALQDDYDFTLERNTVREVVAWEEYQAAEKERREEEAKRIAEEEAQRLAEEERKRLELIEEARRQAEEQEANLAEADVVIKLGEDFSKIGGSVFADNLKFVLDAEPVESSSPEAPAAGNNLEIDVSVVEYNALEVSVEPACSNESQQQVQEKHDVEQLRIAEERRRAEERRLVEDQRRAEELRIAEEHRKWLAAQEERKKREEEERKQAEEVNSFKKYYFPLLTSMAASRSMRDRHSTFTTNLNPAFPLQQSSANHVLSSNPNPYLNAVPSPIQTFPILSHTQSNHVWPSSSPVAGLSTSPMNHYHPAVGAPVLNGPLTHDSVIETNGSHPLPSGTKSSSSQHSLL